MRVLWTGLIISAGIFLLALTICLVDLWLAPAHAGQLYVFGITAGGHSPFGTVLGHAHRSIGIRPAVLVWCLAVPMAFTVLVAYRRRRLDRRGQHLLQQ